MSENKTRPTDDSVDQFLESVEPERRRVQGRQLLTIMEDVTGATAKMWGPSIVGFGTMHYTYASGREGDWMKVGFSPRKAAHSLYGLKEVSQAEPLLEALGPHKQGVGCLYVKDLDAVDQDVLRSLIALAFERPDYVAENTSEGSG